MRVARIRIERFRGFHYANLILPANAVIAGEPQAGRSDVVEALRRVLDSRSTRSRVNPLDIHRPADDGVEDPLTEVEVTLLDLGTELETLLDDSLETFDKATGELATAANAVDAVLGVRLCYRARYDFETDTGDHWVDYPARSEPAANVFRRASRIEREALPVQFIDGVPALQLRAEGALRTLLTETDSDGLDEALVDLDQEVRAATSSFSETAVVTNVLTKVIESGPRDLFGIDDPANIEFLPEDGSLAALLRALQPAIAINAAGMLPVRSHGSTLQNVLSSAEAISAARDAESGIIIGDDFGDGLDASSSEHMAGLIHATANQAILTTRRPEVVRAFNAEELIRLTKSHGTRQQHQLPVLTDKAGRVTRRLALDQLLSALSTRTVVLVEGPLDAEGYGTLATRLFRKTSKREHSLSANGIRLVAPPGPEGGITRLPAIAEIALQLGFHVRAIVDNDKPGQEDPAVATLAGMVEQLIVLPMRTAVEAALIRGVPGDALRKTVETLHDLGMPSLPDGMVDDDIAEHLITKKIIKKQGLGAAWVHALTRQPPIARSVIETLSSDSLGRIDIPKAP